MTIDLTRIAAATLAGAVCCGGVLVPPAGAATGSADRLAASRSSTDAGDLVAARKAQMAADWVGHARERMRVALPSRCGV
ncbi:MAG TPA: hypothetical protein VFT70_00310 [Nocardioides sp.]|nr:hypothetical protein [Nocardioides sp.]